MAKTDYFLKLDGIKGESQDSKYKDQIEISSFSWGETNSSSFAEAPSGGGGLGRVTFQDLHLTKMVDKASPDLAMHCATGKHIKQADLVCRKQGGDQAEYYKVKLTDCLISSYQSGGSSGDGLIPMDQFSINFAAIEYHYGPQDKTGKVGNWVRTGYDLKQNKKI